MADWPCEAYGPEGLEHGARCFFASPGARLCGEPAMCHDLMDSERRRVFRRLQELAAAGDEAALSIVDDFPTPDTLLGGDS